MKVVGITGGIASGKSTLSAYLKDRYKAYIFNADEEAKKLLNDDIVKDKIKETFPNISNLSLKSIANEAFQNKESQKKLNNIIHPMINQMILKKIKEKENSYNLFIIDAALIIESGMFEYHKSNGSKLVLVVADEEIRIQRALERNNLSKETIIDDKTGFLFEAGNSKNLSEKLGEILNLSEVTRNGIGAEGRKNVKVKFNVEKMCNSTYSEYKKLINA